MKRPIFVKKVFSRPEIRLITLLVSAALVLPGAAPVMAQTSPAEVRQGYSLLERGWVNDAIAAFQRALQRSPNSVEARLGLAVAYQRAGQDANAWQAYQQVLAVDPDNRQALSAIGQLGAYRPQWQTAGIEALSELLRLAPDDRAARSQRALLYGYQGRFAESLADYELLLAQSPSPQTQLAAAEIYTYSGDYERALSLFERYAGPLNDSAATAYALALRESGLPDQAVAVLQPRLKPADRLDDSALQVRSALAVAYGANGQLETALELLGPLEGRPAARLPLARALSALGRQAGDPALFEQAVLLYQQVLAATPAPSYGLRLEAADVLSEWPDTQMLAREQFLQLAAENPTVLSLQVKSLVLAHTTQEISAAALATELAPILAALPESAAERRAIAQALIRLDQPDPALLPVYEAALANGLDEPLLLFRLAQMQLQQNNLAAAQTALEQYRATPEGAQDLGVELLIADVERQRGDLEASASRYEALIIANAALPAQSQVTTEALQGLALVRSRQGQPEAAIALYDAALQRRPEYLPWRLGRAYLAYSIGQMSEAEASQLLHQWTTANPPETATLEVIQLAAALPAAAERAELYEQLLSLNPEASGLRWRSIQLLAQRDPAAAEAQLAALVARNPNDPVGYFYQGELAQQQGDLARASSAYETLLQLEPDNIGATAALAGVRFQQGRLDEAKRLYEAVLAQEPENLGARRAIAELAAAGGYTLSALEQLQSLPPGPQTSDVAARVEQLQTDLLRRRGFQPPWERY